jgi:hypothetical protein
MATLNEVLKRMFARPDSELPQWAVVAKRSLRSIESMVVEIRSSKQCRVVAQRSAPPVVTETRAERHKRARAIFAAYPELSFEAVARAKRLGYSEDLMLQLRGAELGERIRQGKY